MSLKIVGFLYKVSLNFCKYIQDKQDSKATILNVSFKDGVLGLCI